MHLSSYHHLTFMIGRANRDYDKEREALEQQARVKGKKGFKPEYNPLMGGGGGSGYRPAARSARSGGG